MTRQERRAINKRAHAIRRTMIDADYREFKAAGSDIRWRDVAAQYDAMSAADVLAEFDTGQGQDDAPVLKVKGPAPEHIRRASTEYQLALTAWETGLADAVAGGRTRAEGGRPARGEDWPDEERDYRAEHPRPVWGDYVTQTAATVRHERRAA